MSESRLFHTFFVPTSWHGRRGARFDSRVCGEFEREEGEIWVGLTLMGANDDDDAIFQNWVISPACNDTCADEETDRTPRRAIHACCRRVG